MRSAAQMRYSVVGQQMIALAGAFATAAHYAVGQRRKYTGEPYIVHPEEVAEKVMAVPGHTWQMVATAWLHDVVEDTQVPIGVIGEVFGAEVMKMVADLTNVPKEAGNRRQRFQMNLDRLATASPATKTVKIADLICNTKSIVACDPKFAPVYLQEKEATLMVLREGDRVLWSIAHEQVVNAQMEMVQNALAH